MKEMVSIYKENITKFDNEKPKFNIFIEEVCTEKARLLSISSLLSNGNEFIEKKERAYTYSEDKRDKNHFNDNKESLFNKNNKDIVPMTNPLQNINLNN